MKITLHVLMMVMAIPFVVGWSEKSTPGEKEVRKACGSDGQLDS